MQYVMDKEVQKSIAHGGYTETCPICKGNVSYPCNGNFTLTDTGLYTCDSCQKQREYFISLYM